MVRWESGEGHRRNTQSPDVVQEEGISLKEMDRTPTQKYVYVERENGVDDGVRLRQGERKRGKSFD